MALGFEVIGLAKIYWVLYALFYGNRAITDLKHRAFNLIHSLLGKSSSSILVV